MGAGDPIRLGAVVTNSIVFETKLRKPFAGLPEGARVRLRVRPNEFPTVLIKTVRGISQHFIEDDGENWRPSSLVCGLNETLQK